MQNIFDRSTMKAITAPRAYTPYVRVLAWIGLISIPLWIVILIAANQLINACI